MGMHSSAYMYLGRREQQIVKEDKFGRSQLITQVTMCHAAYSSASRHAARLSHAHRNSHNSSPALTLAWLRWQCRSFAEAWRSSLCKSLQFVTYNLG